MSDFPIPTISLDVDFIWNGLKERFEKLVDDKINEFCDKRHILTFPHKVEQLKAELLALTTTKAVDYEFIENHMRKILLNEISVHHDILMRLTKENEIKEQRKKKRQKALKAKTRAITSNTKKKK